MVESRGMCVVELMNWSYGDSLRMNLSSAEPSILGKQNPWDWWRVFWVIH